jgi:predicted glycosyltransferase
METEMQNPVNIYLLSQHSLGVGHLNRTSLLAGEMAKIPGVCVTHISGGPSTGILSPRPGVSFVELPPLVINSFKSTDLVSVEKGKTKEDVEKERVRIIRGLLDERNPGLFITEFFPFSPHRLDGTVLPILSHIRDKYPHCGIVCSCRDIPVCHGEVLTAEGVARINSILDSYYDMLLIHADPAVLKFSDVPVLRRLKPLCPVVYTGYIAERRNADPLPHKAQGKILVTVGGGRDGLHIIECAIRVAACNEEYEFDLICGPFMEETKVKELRGRVTGLTNVRLHWYVPDLKETVNNYDLVICPGGYNTLIEAIVRKKRCISIPRKNSYEQRKRVKVFTTKGLLLQVPESRLTGPALSRLIESALHARHVPVCNVNTEGLRNTLRIVEQWVPSSSRDKHFEPFTRGSAHPAAEEHQ